MTRDEVLLRLWPRPESCSRARRATRQFCAAHDLAEFTDDAELLTSEVVGNAVRHSDGMVTVLIAAVGRSLAVTVSDNRVDGIAVDGAAPTNRREPPGPLDERGRGLVVLSALAGEWGVTPTRHGKTVWFRLP